MEFVVLQIGVMDQLGQPLHRPVPNAEAIDQGLERAMIAVMAELDIEHVVRDGLGVGGRLVPKNEFCFRIDEFPDEPGRSDTVDFRPCEPAN
ncbi:MAG: hypothetical protein QOI53_3530 [Verrucomicrobiota bacterium]|nr:hypothetical protein [Verrucomicrobiota bacterium]